MPNPAADLPANARWMRMIEQCSGTAAAAPPQRARAHQGAYRALPVASPSVAGPPSERELLRQQLPATVRLLAARRANLLSERLVDQYVAMNWLEWHGGTLRLTPVGRNFYDGVMAETRYDDPDDDDEA